MYRLENDEEAEDERMLQGFDAISTRVDNRLRNARRQRLVKRGLIGMGVLVGIVLVISIAVSASRAASAPWGCPPLDSNATTFFVIGDWGRKGNANQRRAAAMMADVAGCMPPSFILSTGDNFYSHGLSSVEDAQMNTSWRDVYNAPSLAHVPWYAVLGNHDYADGISPTANADCAGTSLSACPDDCCYSPVWQYSGRFFNDARWHCSNGSWALPADQVGALANATLPGQGVQPLLDVIMLDTSPFISRYQAESWKANAEGLALQDPEAIRRQLRAHLAASSARWKLVVGHHPISSFGSHCKFGMGQDCEDMKWLEPELQAAGVAAYFSGHDHNLQYNVRLSDPTDLGSAPVRPVYVVSGAGSDVRAGEFAKYKPKEGYNMRYAAEDQGFVAVQASPSQLSLHFYASSHLQPVFSQVLLPA